MLRSLCIGFFFFFSCFVFFVKKQLGCKAVNMGDDTPLSFIYFQKQYLYIFGLAWLAEWLQGPYIYSLYSSYGYNIDQIGRLFAVGSGVAGICGVFVGALADKMGRKKACIAYTVVYALACVMKHFSNYGILMIGICLGGTATALLYTVFESWMVSHHKANQWSDELLGSTFTKSGQLNGIMAVLAGVVASTAADAYGPIAPFDISIVVLLIAMCFISRLPENYGQTNSNIFDTIKNGLDVLFMTSNVLYLGLSQAFFEGGMFIFVFVWTPVLEEVQRPDEFIPFGYVFSCFMVACILGSTLFGYFRERGHSAEWLAFWNYLAAIAVLWTAVTVNMYVRLFSCILFELCVGWFWPCAMTLRGRHIPEGVRATIMNFFRIPLNIIVVVVLLRIEFLPVEMVLKCCAFCMSLAAICQLVVIRSGPSIQKIPIHLISETLQLTKSVDEVEGII